MDSIKKAKKKKEEEEEETEIQEGGEPQKKSPRASSSIAKTKRKMDWHALSHLLQLMSAFWVKECSAKMGDSFLLDIGNRTDCEPDLCGTVHEKEVWIAWYANDIGLPLENWNSSDETKKEEEEEERIEEDHGEQGPVQTPARRDHHTLLKDWFRDYNLAVTKNKRCWVALISVPLSYPQAVHSYQDLSEESDSSSSYFF